MSTTRKSPRTEHALRTQVLTWIRKQDVYVVKYHGSPFTQVGVPDLLMCIAGHFVAIELKSASGKLTEAQRVNIDAIRYSGGQAFVCRSLADVQDVVLNRGEFTWEHD